MFEFTRREMNTMRPGVYLSTGEHKLHPLNHIHGEEDVAQYLTDLNKDRAARDGSTTCRLRPNGNTRAAGSQPTTSLGTIRPSWRSTAFCGPHAARERRVRRVPQSSKAKAPGAVYFGDRQAGIFSYAQDLE